MTAESCALEPEECLARRRLTAVYKRRRWTPLRWGEMRLKIALAREASTAARALSKAWLISGRAMSIDFKTTVSFRSRVSRRARRPSARYIAHSLPMPSVRSTSNSAYCSFWHLSASRAARDCVKQTGETAKDLQLPQYGLEDSFVNMSFQPETQQ
jgi:hypothetical protein